MNRYIFSLCIISMLLSLSPLSVNASQRCAVADPNSVEQVFECVSTATINIHNNANPFSNVQRAMCNNLKSLYNNVLVQNGVSRDALAEKTPSCEVFAKVMYELNGELPIWNSCLAYDGSTRHMVNCLSGMLDAAGKGRANKQLLANCNTAQTTYEMLLMSLQDDPNSFKMREDYKRIECDQYLSALSQKEPEIEDSPCAGFDPDNVQSHAKKCLLADQSLTKTNTPLNCQALRISYQNNLIRVYGKIPQGFRLLSCSSLDSIIDEILSLR